MYYPQQTQDTLWQHPIYAHPHHHPHPQHILSPPLTQHWQQQLLKYEVSVSRLAYVHHVLRMLATQISRASHSPHHRARSSMQSAARPVAKSAIPITNPNGPKAPPTPSSGEATTPDVNHPSSTVAPIAEAPRPSNKAVIPSNTWHSLDMGGVALKSLPSTSSLWSLSFLSNLYLNHNALTLVPPEIASLKHLELLDLSANQLRTLPKQIGMLTTLKEFYVFDNLLQTLPPEFGTLHQLQCLGVEGNPLDPQLKQIVQEKGTTALIAYLRDSCPVPSPPPARILKSLLSPAERAALYPRHEEPETMSALCYNILCEKYATERLYGYTPQWALDWDYRKELILNEILGYNADFLCLQEVSGKQYDEFFTSRLTPKSYSGIYFQKSRARNMPSSSDRSTVDGCATFYRSSTYTLIESHLIEFSTHAMQRSDFKKTEDMFNRVLGKDNIGSICLFEHRHTGTRVIIANAHITWNPDYSDVKLVQVALLVEEIEQAADRFAKLPPRKDLDSPAPPTYSDGTKIPIILAADLNSVPESGVYEFLSTGYLPKDHADFMGHTYGKYTSEGLRHRLGLKSAYCVGSGSMVEKDSSQTKHKLTPNGNPYPPPSLAKAKEAGGGKGELLPLTNFTPSFQGVLDYIWYSGGNLAVNSVLGPIDGGYLEKVVGFPNAHFPSDHICIMSEFRVKPPKDIPAQSQGKERPVLPKTPSH
ncbi:ccr4-not complex subunit ccr4 [Moniliophthora roreri MCA 2997]|uniref:CCR4-Not complex 3'-5'-exoribonuclease subunit Ccr4 n=1 Tax=Moniliophthora roreri (strain MCA 2997) TaxID=1381753 RepID=V2WQK4_MONRO|nr:ccr4-not complex subunit ccr4 [Moniliophthora roreri MCA 2997]